MKTNNMRWKTRGSAHHQTLVITTMLLTIGISEFCGRSEENKEKPSLGNEEQIVGDRITGYLDKFSVEEVEAVLPRTWAWGEDIKKYINPRGNFVNNLILILDKNLGAKYPLEIEIREWPQALRQTLSITEEALYLLRPINTDEVVDAIAKYASHGNSHLRQKAIECLGYTKNRHAHDILVTVAQKREKELPDKLDAQNFLAIEMPFADVWVPIASLRRLDFPGSREYAMQLVERLRKKYEKTPEGKKLVFGVEEELKSLEANLKQEREETEKNKK